MRENTAPLTLRVKIALAIVCLLIALIAAGLAARNTVQGFHSLQRQQPLAKSGDVQTIRSWMTIPYIARTYHVPEQYLYRTLHLNPASSSRRATLHALASHYQKPVTSLIHDVQHAIVTYRKAHVQTHSPPVASPTLPGRKSSMLVGRTGY